MCNLKELWREELLKNSQYLNEIEHCGVNMALMHQIKKNSALDKKNSDSGTSGVYRKLNND